MLKRENNKQYFGYCIKVESYCSVNEPDGEDNWAEDWQHDIADFITKVNYGQVPDIVTSYELEANDTVYLVYAKWSTGDSFGRASGGSFEPIAIFKEEEEAKKFSEALEKADSEKPFHYKANDGQEFYCKNLWWSGFFSSLDTVDYTPVTMIERE